MDHFPRTGPAAALTQTFLSTLQSAQTTDTTNGIVTTATSGDAHSFAPEDIMTDASLQKFHVGNGLSVTKLLCHELLTAQSEILLVTGFWAKSASRDLLRLTLKELDRLQGERLRVSMSSRGGTAQSSKLRIRIGFSSQSLSQKLFQTSSPNGKIWAPNTWVKKLGLPAPSDLTNIDLEVKSIFHRPVSLLHGKYVIIDRRKLVLPSGNISWEDWLEGCGVYEGGIVGCFTRFYESVWGHSGTDLNCGQSVSDGSTMASSSLRKPIDPGSITIPPFLLPPPTTVPLPTGSSDTYIPTIFLPHPHHASLPPIFPLALLPMALYHLFTALFSFLYPRPPPLSLSTTKSGTNEDYLSNPQNAFIITALDNAVSSIYLHTPNVTCPAILRALLRAARRGVVVEIVTSRRMMVLEQLVTAGTTTEHCLRKLLRDAKRAEVGADRVCDIYVYYYTPSLLPLPLPSTTATAVASTPPGTGSSVSSVSTRNGSTRSGVSYGSNSSSGRRAARRTPAEKVKANKSHVKCLIVDESIVVLGSGNADVASWVTSQEVNVALYCGPEVARSIRVALVEQVEGRVKMKTTVEQGEDEWLDDPQAAARARNPAPSLVPRRRYASV